MLFFRAVYVFFLIFSIPSSCEDEAVSVQKQTETLLKSNDNFLSSYQYTVSCRATNAQEALAAEGVAEVKKNVR